MAAQRRSQAATHTVPLQGGSTPASPRSLPDHHQGRITATRSPARRAPEAAEGAAAAGNHGPQLVPAPAPPKCRGAPRAERSSRWRRGRLGRADFRHESSRASGEEADRPHSAVVDEGDRRPGRRSRRRVQTADQNAPRSRRSTRRAARRRRRARSRAGDLASAAEDRHSRLCCRRELSGCRGIGVLSLHARR